jgi:hypothetical protein
MMVGYDTLIDYDTRHYIAQDPLASRECEASSASARLQYDCFGIFRLRLAYRLSFRRSHTRQSSAAPRSLPSVVVPSELPRFRSTALLKTTMNM